VLLRVDFFQTWLSLPWKRFKSPFFVSMAPAAKFVQPIPIVLTYHVPLTVDVVPIKFHQFLFRLDKLCRSCHGNKKGGI
jgi:hypothetical protein